MPEGRQRILTKSELKLVILSLLNAAPRHGYEIIRSIKKLSKGAYSPSSGVVYPALNLLEDEALITPYEEVDGRKIFSVTKAGEAEVVENAAEITALESRLSELSEVTEVHFAPVERALINLQMVLDGVASSSSTDQIHEMVSIIDEAAQRIERL